ncbi:acylneuraminate cytidylyltransferase family protein [Lutibacter sp.]|uniref:acylneuraminate cytidylyltransferase family protein n=1 Tax=Lutibacter sp. TaxID=1925666 RepID=UPI0025BC905F|nr:acylneuraminate cytidylyltransferase family protein [Lutibacter sp.]MCF6182890.1 acylneuraminate cytidylyltransferase family protein [Lutibacter sp.]
MNNTIAIIPARGSSKRLPNKNVKLLGGIPLLVHSINYAKANKINKIVVTTDNKEIKNIALKNNVEVIDRPKELSGDLATTVSALKHVLKNVKEVFENVILLQPTNPLRPKNLLKEAFHIFNKGNYDSLMAVSRNHQKFGKIINNKFEPFNYKIGQRSQDLAPLYFENGLLYITKASLILEGKILGKNNYPFIVNHPFASVDIDTKEDFEYAEYLLSHHFE